MNLQTIDQQRLTVFMDRLPCNEVMQRDTSDVWREVSVKLFKSRLVLDQETILPRLIDPSPMDIDRDPNDNMHDSHLRGDSFR